LRAFGAVAIKAAAAAAAFASNVLIARLLGPEASGVVFLALALFTFGSIVGLFGMDNVVTRHVAFASARAARGIVRWTAVRSFGVAIVVTVGLVVASPWLARTVFNTPHLAPTLAVLAFSVAPFAFTSTFGSALRSRDRILVGMLVQFFAQPAAFAAILAIIWGTGLAVSEIDVALTHVATYVLVSIAAWLAWSHWRGMHREYEGSDQVRSDARPTSATLWSDARLFATIGGMNLLIDLTDRVLLGAMLGPESVAFYTAALKSASFGTLVLAGVNSYIGPRLAALHQAERHLELAITIRRVTRAMAAIAIGFTLTAGLLARPLMGLFGPQFDAAVVPFLVLIAGQLVVLATGPVAQALMMTGNGFDHRLTIALAAVTNLVLSLALIPSLGMIGAAVGTAVSLSGKNLLAVIFVRRRLGFWILP